MLQDAPGSPDGITINEYSKGREYDVPAGLAAVLIAEHLAEEVVSTKRVPKANKKAAPSENK